MVGDSNLAYITQLDTEVQVDIFPGSTFIHITGVLKKQTTDRKSSVVCGSQ